MSKSCRRSNSKAITTSAVVGKSCAICLSDLEIREAALVIPCLHAYCILCIRKWSNLKLRCPLCNADLDPWFYKFDVSSRKFRKEKLQQPSGEGKRGINWADVLEEPPLPRQLRSFGRDSNGERVKRWRASIYEQRLRAVPPSRPENLIGHRRETVLYQIEPWIHRELQAVLYDPDPTIIVHVATSIFLARHEKKQQAAAVAIIENDDDDFLAPLQQQEAAVGIIENDDDDFLAPLRRFLGELTDMFWHELTCFAHTPCPVEVYDTVVEYQAPSSTPCYFIF